MFRSGDPDDYYSWGEYKGEPTYLPFTLRFACSAFLLPCFAFLLPSVALGVTRAQRSGLEIDGLDVMLANA